MTEIETVNGLRGIPGIEVGFVWTPTSSSSLTFGSPPVTLTEAGALVNTSLTFTATATIADSYNATTIATYFWDFGDGTQGFGNPVTHAYKVPNLQAFTVVRVLDNHGRVWCARRQMYLH